MASRGCFLLRSTFVTSRTNHITRGLNHSRFSRVRSMATSVQEKMALVGPEEQRCPVWPHFFELTCIPRPSGHEQAVCDFLKDFATKRGLEYQTDSVGNVLIRRPGTAGGEDAPCVVIQNHIDMVTEKNSDVEHDFFRDPIKCRRDGDWIGAVGTTLGADNGVGAAAALAILDMPATAKMPPIECLFTVDEETGMTGAFELDGAMVQGRTLLNLDSEDWGHIFVGCAGGGDTAIRMLTPAEAPAEGTVALEVSVSGLLGGHSGLNIAENRGNAVKILADVLAAILRVEGARISRVDAGDKRNAIAREGRAVVVVPEGSKGEVGRVVERCMAEARQEYGILEKTLCIASTPVDLPATVVAPAAGAALVSLLRALPHGVEKGSHALADLVETSTNLASVRPAEGGAAHEIVTCTRSSLPFALERLRDRIAIVAAALGAEVHQDDAYPGWAPDPSSKVVQIVAEEYAKMAGPGAAAKVGAIHAGLECGIIGERVGKGMDMVSFGPTITGAHSPDERVCVPTVGPFFDLCVAVLGRLADVRA